MSVKPSMNITVVTPEYILHIELTALATVGVAAELADRRYAPKISTERSSLRYPAFPLNNVLMLFIQTPIL
jgi:hypothetical protein